LRAALQRSDFAYGHCPNVEDVLRIIFALRLTVEKGYKSVAICSIAERLPSLTVVSSLQMSTDKQNSVRNGTTVALRRRDGGAGLGPRSNKVTRLFHQWFRLKCWFRSQRLPRVLIACQTDGHNRRVCRNSRCTACVGYGIRVALTGV